jgi:prepilin-type N-terminal cleavage/methylation domain-containing protein
MIRIPQRPNRNQIGFTLLEVIVALTITGMVLGGLFTLSAGSKQLAFRSGVSLTRALEARAAINFALLQDEYSDVEEILEPTDFASHSEDRLAAVPRKTEPITYALQEFEVVNERTDDVITGTRWARLELPE